MIKKDNQTIDKIYKGTTEIAKIYKGSTLVYENYRDIVATGNDIINITKAKAGSLNYLKAFGKCEQTGTPTPSNPIPIYCNNGQIKARNTSGLPLGYTKLKYIHNESAESSGAYINFNLQPTANSVLEVKLSTNDISAQILVATPVNASLPYRIVKFSSSRKIGASVGNINYISNYDGSTPAIIKIDHKKIYANNVLIGDGTENQISTYTNINLLKGDYGGSSVYYSTGKIYYLYISIDGVNASFNGIPAKRNYDNVIGLYDTVSNTFFTSSNINASFEGGDVDDSVEIYADGTVENIKDTLNNTAIAQNLLALSSVKDVQEVLAGTITQNIKVKILDGTENWILSGSGSTAYFFVGGWSYDALMSSTSPACLCTHYEGFMSSKTMGSIGIRVGTNGNNQVSRYYLYLRDTSFTNVEDLKQYLAQQCINGTPVIIAYPLATAITKTVTPQSMNIQKGTNIIEVTEASLNNLELEAKYKGK